MVVYLSETCLQAMGISSGRIHDFSVRGFFEEKGIFSSCPDMSWSKPSVQTCMKKQKQVGSHYSLFPKDETKTFKALIFKKTCLPSQNMYWNPQNASQVGLWLCKFFQDLPSCAELLVSYSWQIGYQQWTVSKGFQDMYIYIYYKGSPN